jgi:ferritin-like metal-binding protein YciE
VHFERRTKTEGQIERLENIFELLGKPARGKKCDAIDGILDEGQEGMGAVQGHARARRRLAPIEPWEIRRGTICPLAHREQKRQPSELRR